MADQSGLESFPSIAPTSHQFIRREPSKPHQSGGTRLRRKSSSLHGEPRGDATGPALATVYDATPNGSPSPSPPSVRYSMESEVEAQNAAYAMQKRASDRPRRSKRRKIRSFFKRWKSLSLRHTWVNPLIVCLTVGLLYLANPTASNHLHSALFLSYPIPRKAGDDPSTPILYGKGPRDFAFVAFYIVFLSFTREFIMQRMLRPLARRWGITARGKQARFMEQAYTALYFSIFGPFGLYVMYNSDLWYFRTDTMYATFPNREHTGIFKAYYLLQASYWAQQGIVLLLMLEKPRKDFKELVAHHIITLALIGLSYRFHFTNVGIAVYITHDISDFFLATSKILNYLDSSLTVPYFVFFLGVWTYLRHYINIRILLSMLPLPSPFPDNVTNVIHGYLTIASSHIATILAPALAFVAKAAPHATEAFVNSVSNFKVIQFAHDAPSQFATIGPYQLDWDTQQYKCWISHYITFGLLAALQGVNLFWLFLVLRILWRVVKTLGQEQRDERSEDDSDEDEERQQELEKMRKEQGEIVPSVAVNGKIVAGKEKL